MKKEAKGLSQRLVQYSVFVDHFDINEFITAASTFS
ncbi:hypothetical protein COLO4_20646 [Corchorus olitorius]|uniref:Uncharacterized protein n=1 Tax=Corchorus olitorius TaxID=93759 RepID=A0A1R3IY44_9ROSI|nr:hypothetical protein COLO4_20646 [Corchorus olitorius]